MFSILVQYCLYVQQVHNYLFLPSGPISITVIMLICTRIDNSLPQPQERNLLQQNQFQTTDVESYTIYIPTMLLKRQCCSVRISGASGFLFCFDMQGIIYYHANLMHCLYNNQSS